MATKIIKDSSISTKTLNNCIEKLESEGWTVKDVMAVSGSGVSKYERYAEIIVVLTKS